MKVRAKISANIMLVLTGEYVGMDYNDCVQQALEACRERGKSVNETTVLQSQVRRFDQCDRCGGTGSVPSGVCHCGADMIDQNIVAHDDHTPVEMDGPCDKCGGSGEQKMEATR
jgi:hypothetical protein